MKYAAFDNERVIWGVGDTVDAAIEDAKSWLDTDCVLGVEQCTDSLYQRVIDGGGQVEWEWVSIDIDNRVMDVMD